MTTRGKRWAVWLGLSLAVLGGLAVPPAQAEGASGDGVWPAGFPSHRGWLASPLREIPGPVLPPTRMGVLLGGAPLGMAAVGGPLGGPPPRATWAGWLPSLLLAGAWIGVELAVDPPADSRWTDRNSFDSAIRRGLRGGSRSTRKNAEHASDAIFAATAVALAADWWWLRDEYGFLRSVQVDTRYLLGNNLVTRVAKVSAGRQRPYVQPCGRDNDYVPSCGSGRDKNAGFWSGHASNSATLAGLLCARHLGRQERGLLDVFVCGGAVAGALTTGIMRIVSEHHFATDVIAGWATGAVFGYMLPRALDYQGDPGGALSPTSFAPEIRRDYYGLRYGFRF